MRALALCFALPLLGLCLLVLQANGLTATTLAASLPFFLLLSMLFRRWRVALGLLLAGLGFVGARLLSPRGEAWSGGALWQRLIDEREATRAGLYLSRWVGAMRGAEFDRFDALIDAQWAAMPEGWRGLPNPLLMHSTAAHVEAVRFHAAGSARRPCVIFLHGFGGLLSLYVRAIVTGTHGAFDVVAPALDPLGAWWTPRGQAVLRATLDALPPEVDRAHVYLVGLSNGGIGATQALPAGAGFAGVVLLSGIDALPAEVALDGRRVLVLSGADDPRFPLTFVEQQAAQLSAQGAEVTLQTFPADHFLILTRSDAWTRAFTRWATAGDKR